MIISILILSLAALCAGVLVAFIVTELVSFVKRSIAKRSSDIGISVDDLVKVDGRNAFRVESIVRDHKGQWIIVDEWSDVHVIQPEDDFILWS